MIIDAITYTKVRIPLKKPFVTALRRVDAVESLRVTLHADTGIDAVGEAPPTVAITGESMDSIEQTIAHRIAPKLLHVNFSTMSAMLHVLHTSSHHHTSAKAAVDMAIYRLYAQAASQPLLHFIGGTQHHPIETYVTISLNTPQQMAADAIEAYRNGYHLLKIKVGSPDGKDGERILHVNRAVPQAKLIIDANQAWSYEQSIRIIDALHGIDIVAIEQPVIAHDTDALRAVTAYSPIDIIADEAVFSLDDAQKIIATNGADIINIKLMKCGGISKALEIIALCRDHQMPCMMGSMLEGVSSIEAALHVAMAHRDVIQLVDLDSPILYETMPRHSVISCKERKLSITTLDSSL